MLSLRDPDSTSSLPSGPARRRESIDYRPPRTHSWFSTFRLPPNEFRRPGGRMPVVRVDCSETPMQPARSRSMTASVMSTHRSPEFPPTPAPPGRYAHSSPGIHGLQALSWKWSSLSRYSLQRRVGTQWKPRTGSPDARRITHGHSSAARSARNRFPWTSPS